MVRVHIDCGVAEVGLMERGEPVTPDPTQDEVTAQATAPADAPTPAASDVRIFRVPNKLRDKLLNGGGARAAELLAKAESNLEFMRPRCLNLISDVIAEIIAEFGAANRKGDEAFDRLYALSAKIIDVSSPVASLEIDRAAFSLCELVDRCEGQGQWDWPSIDVHIDALVLLRQDAGSLSPEARQIIFSGLDKLNQRLPSMAVSIAARDGGGGDPIAVGTGG